MSDHWRIGVVERCALETLDDLGARPDRPHVKSVRVVRQMADVHGVSPSYGYDSLCKLSQPWLQQIALVDFHGNGGSPDDRPANPRYTEVRLSRAGEIALDAERGAGPKVPIALINGDLHVGGLAPPYSPTRVVAALRTMIDNRPLADAEIVELVGPPASPTGCDMACDYQALGAGDPTTLVLQARLTVEVVDDAAGIVITNLPLGVGVDAVTEALAGRVNLQSRLNREVDREGFAKLALPLRGLRDESLGDATRIVCQLRSGADPATVGPEIASTWGVGTRCEVQLAAPLAQLMRELVDEDPEAQRNALAALANCLGS